MYGAYQRGLYKTAFDLATKRAQDNGDPKAMTMLGELYANAFGVKRDDAKAVDWYKRAADAGDREAMFELAMLRLAGRGGPVNREEAVETAGVLGQARQPQGGLQSGAALSRRTDAAAGPQTLRRNCCVSPPTPAIRKRNTRSRPSTRRAPASPKDVEKAARLLQAASLADNVDAEVEYAIALYNGTGTPKNEAAAVALLRKAARQNNPIAQNRLARVLVSGQGAPVDKIEAPQMAHDRQNRRQGRPRCSTRPCRS